MSAKKALHTISVPSDIRDQIFKRYKYPVSLSIQEFQACKGATHTTDIKI